MRRSLGGVQVEGDLGRVDFQRELHAALAKHVQNRIESFGQQFEARLDHLLRHGREGVEQRPDARTCEPVDDAYAELLGGARRVHQLFRRPLVDTLRIPFAPHVRRHDGLVALVDHVQHRLPDQVIADRQALQVVPLQQIALLPAVVVVGQRLVDLEVVSPTRQLQSFIAELGSLARHFRQRQVGPLAGEESNGSCHDVLLLDRKR